MRLRLLPLALILSAGAIAVGQPPSAPPQVLLVPVDTPVSFFIWDPLDAEANEYSFVLVRLPSSGVLIGIAPEFVYVPDPGFSGTDWITYAVQDPFGRFDLAVVQIVVLPADAEVGPPSVGLSGAISVAGMPVTLTAASFETFYAQRFRFFDQELRGTWGLTGFTSLSARTKFELIIPGATTIRIPIVSTLAFDPSIPSLKSWTVSISTKLPDLDASLAVFYDGLAPETGSTATAAVGARIGDIRAEGTTVFSWLPVEFSSQTLKLSGPAPAFWCTGCEFRFEAVYSFTKADGFKQLRLAALDLPFPCSFCEWFTILIDLRVTYATDLKTVSPALRLRSPVSVCLRPLILLMPVDSGFGLGGIWAYGFEARCDLQGGQGLRFATSFDDLKNASVTGDSRFFEVWQAYGPILPCCGPRGRWQLSTFFKREPGTLFGWGMSDFVLHFPLDNQVLLNIGLKFGEVDPLDPTKTWLLTIGMKGLW